MEMLCDEEVLGAGSKSERKEYSEVIMSCVLEENTDKTMLSTSFVHGTEFMKRRFENIFDARKKKVGVACITGVCSIVILLSGTMRIEENLLQNSAAKDEQNTELQTPTKEEV